MLSGGPFRWWISGGRALELHAGRQWRVHSDTDVGIRRDQATEVFRWLADSEMWLAARGVLRPWTGDRPDPDAGENNVWVVGRGDRAWCLDITIGAGTDAEWVYRRDQRIKRPWDEAVLTGRDAVPYLAPDLQLLFKSKNPRPKDDVDAHQVVPLLSGEQRLSLRRTLPEDHPWQVLLAGGSRL